MAVCMRTGGAYSSKAWQLMGAAERFLLGLSKPSVNKAVLSGRSLAARKASVLSCRFLSGFGL